MKNLMDQWLDRFAYDAQFPDPPNLHLYNEDSLHVGALVRAHLRGGTSVIGSGKITTLPEQEPNVYPIVVMDVTEEWYTLHELCRLPTVGKVMVK